MPVIIRKAAVTDAEYFAQINEVIWGTPVKRDIINYFAKGISRFENGYYLAESEGKYVGSSEGFPFQEKLPIKALTGIEDPVDLYDPGGQYYYIHIIQVYPEFRNNGVGNRLLNAQIETAKTLHAAQVCGIAISGQLKHWLRSGFKAEGQWGKYKNYGQFKWVSMCL